MNEGMESIVSSEISRCEFFKLFTAFPAIDNLSSKMDLKIVRLR